jgi:DNA-binding NarL/FixJ family response regulator
VLPHARLRWYPRANSGGVYGPTRTCHAPPVRRALERQRPFALVVTGVLNRQIAAELVIAEKRVKVHRGPVMEDMRAGSLPEWVRLGRKRDVISATS